MYTSYTHSRVYTLYSTDGAHNSSPAHSESWKKLAQIAAGQQLLSVIADSHHNCECVLRGYRNATNTCMQVDGKGVGAKAIFDSLSTTTSWCFTEGKREHCTLAMRVSFKLQHNTSSTVWTTRVTVQSTTSKSSD